MVTIEIDRLGLRPGARVLDLGCGDGRHARALRRIPGVDVVALDIGEDEVRKTSSSLREIDRIPFESGGSHPKRGVAGVVRGSGFALPFRDEDFDALIVSEVLEHLEEDDRALDEISRVLRRRGALAVSVPREGPEAVCWALSRRYRNTPGGHVRIYRRRALRRKLERHGYRILGRHFAHGLHSPYWWLKCLVGVDRDDALLVRLYHRFLVWDMMSAPRTTRFADALLSPFVGKSVVFYTERAC